MATFDELREYATQHPTISSLPRLASFYLDELSIYQSVEAFHRDLYDPDYQFERDVIINTEKLHPSYPRIRCESDPVTPALNAVVDWTDRAHHDQLHTELLTQSGIKSHIIEQTATERLVILVVVDGLSYEDARKMDFPIEPVVVDGITTTEPGFNRVIFGRNKVSVYSALLKNHQFFDVLGFTYWNRGQEDLSTNLHNAMGDNVHRIRDFGTAINHLDELVPLSEKTYVQITRMGFDQDSHNRKEEPDRDAIRDRLATDIRDLQSVASKLTDRFTIYVTADHGILWRDQLPPDPPVIFDEWEHHARFVDGNRSVAEGLTIQDADNNMTTALSYPALTRELKNTEWGVHGGFSYYESIIPLIQLTGRDTT